MLFWTHTTMAQASEVSNPSTFMAIPSKLIFHFKFYFVCSDLLSLAYIGESTTNQDFAIFWTQLANQFKSNPKVSPSSITSSLLYLSPLLLSSMFLFLPFVFVHPVFQVIFGLMNEPYHQSAQSWEQSAQVSFPPLLLSFSFSLSFALSPFLFLTSPHFNSYVGSCLRYQTHWSHTVDPGSWNLLDW